MAGPTAAGTVFKITPSWNADDASHVLLPDGLPGRRRPYGAGLVQATDGNFYGTTWAGGAVVGPAVGRSSKSPLRYADDALQLQRLGRQLPIAAAGPGHQRELLRDHCTQRLGLQGHARGMRLTTLGYVGGFPYAGLVQATDGNFYGTTYVGGGNNNANQCQNNGCGSIFEITPVGTITTLYSFCSQTGCVDGVSPSAGLMQATNGSLYGTTTGGGTSGIGTVFSLNVGLGPFVETRPTSAKVGAIVTILGNNLKPVSNVAFNGTAAVFTVVSSSKITATVPNGATTGTSW